MDRIPGISPVATATLASQKLYVVVDNFSPHKRKEVHDWYAANDVELMFLPACSSWLNWIAYRFATLRTFAVNSTGHRSHSEQDDAIAAGIRRRSQHARPERDFAVTPEIRLPDYLPYLA